MKGIDLEIHQSPVIYLPLNWLNSPILVLEKLKIPNDPLQLGLVSLRTVVLLRKYIQQKNKLDQEPS